MVLNLSECRNFNINLNETMKGLMRPEKNSEQEEGKTPLEVQVGPRVVVRARTLTAMLVVAATIIILHFIA